MIYNAEFRDILHNYLKVPNISFEMKVHYCKIWHSDVHCKKIISQILENGPTEQNNPLTKYVDLVGLLQMAGHPQSLAQYLWT